VDTKKVGGDGGGRCWNSLLGGEQSSNPLVHEISITLHRQGEKREPRSPHGSGRSCILGGGGAWGWRLRPRPSKGHHWPQHGLNMAQQGYNMAQQGHNMAQQGHNMVSTRPQHGLNTATTWPQHAKRRIGLFAQNFLPKLQKKLSLMFRHSYLACLLSWRTPLPFRLGWR
jgi:hypothetical protein